MLAIKAISAELDGRPLLNDISLFVQRGEIVGLFGPSGAGKTSLFRALTGQLRITRGEIRLSGLPITGLPLPAVACRGLGYVPQGPSVLRAMSVEQNLGLALETIWPHGAARRARLDRLLAEFGLERVRRSKGGMLSGGERRRCEIARVAAGNPEYLLLDEPFAAIDPIGISDLGRLLRRLCETGIGVLLTDHNLHHALSTVDRAYVMDKGALIAGGLPEDLLENPEVRTRYLGERFKF